MIHFHRRTLPNGLRVLVNVDRSTPLAAVCLTYFVGTRDEEADCTGFAHLFEHLMFGGSQNAPNFDDYVQRAGGENNAYTTQDMTVYYESLPTENIDVALWLEADRMRSLTLNKKALNVQRKVVVEEFKETCLGEPYGDVWHHLAPMVYTRHPYQVPTIGKEIAHIEGAELSDVKSFFERFYAPNNAVLVISGDVDVESVYARVEHYFGDIAPSALPLRRTYEQEPEQTSERRKVVRADVPLNGLYIAFPAAGRGSSEYYADCLLTDILAEGEASRLQQRLVKSHALFSEIDAYTTATIDPAMIVIEGKISEGRSFEEAESAVWAELEALKTVTLGEWEWEKLQNRVEHSLVFAEMGASTKAANLGFFEWLGGAEAINEETKAYRAVSAERLQARAQEIFRRERSSTLLYEAKATDIDGK